MDELKSSLEIYQVQLAQIESAICNGQEDGELLTLQEEMKELIKLTEESLLAYEKSNLLSSLNKNQNDLESETNDKPESSSSNDMEDLMASFYAEINSCEEDVCREKEPEAPTKSSDSKSANGLTFDEDSSDNESICSSKSDESVICNDEFLKTIEDSDDISGVRCQAPYDTEWSGRQFHNAMIMSVLNDDRDDAMSQEAIFVKVLFLNPTLEKMKPCPYLLDGKCRFDESDCKFCHGIPVSLYKLRKFKEPDFSNFTRNSRCLAKHPNGIWHPAVLIQILDNHQYEIQFSHQNLTSKLNIDDVLPLPRDEDSSDSSEEEEDVVIVINESEANSNKSSTSSLGRWEEHTTGFGSKMLMKFGYKMGDGLGKDRKGRVEPVPVVVLPPGKSLDHCMKIREKKLGIIDPTANSSHRHKRHRPNVFHFLNKTLGDHKKSEDYLRKLLPKDSFGIKKENPKSGAACKIKVELVKNESKIKQLKDRMKRYKDSIARNQARDPGVAKKQQVKLNEAIAELKSIQSTNKAIELHQNRADTHRKMTKF